MNCCRILSIKSMDVDQNIDPQQNPKCINILVGGFIPFEKYESNCIIPPGRGENKKVLESTT